MVLTHGFVWQLATYWIIHQGILNTAFELLSLWFLGSFLETQHGPRWLAEIFFVSVIGSGLAGLALAAGLRDANVRSMAAGAASLACSSPSACSMRRWNS